MDTGSDFLGTVNTSVSDGSDFLEYLPANDITHLSVVNDDYNRFIDDSNIEVSAIVCIEDDRLVCYDRGSESLRLLSADLSVQNRINVGVRCTAMAYMKDNEVALSSKGRIMTYKIAGTEFIKQEREWNIDGFITAMSFSSHKLAIFFTTRNPAGQLRIKLIDTEHHTSEVLNQTFHDVEDYHFNSFRLLLTKVGVVLCDLNDHVVCINQSDGSIIWNQPVEKPSSVLLISHPSECLLVIGPHHGNITVLNARTGKRLTSVTGEMSIKGRNVVAVQTTMNSMVTVENKNSVCLLRKVSLQLT